MTLVALLLCASPLGARAEPLLVPGRMGYNALPALRIPDPVIGERVEVEVSAAAQVSSLVGARDTAATPYFRVTVPFLGAAALEVDGVPLEVFQVSSGTQARLGASRRTGVAKGDLRVAARFLLANERVRMPALGLQLVVKSTTGKALDALRFTNAPGYAFDVLAGKDVLGTPALRLRAVAKLGFLAWQVAEGKQDDALNFGAALRATFRSGAALGAEVRGYTGWLEHDDPVVFGMTAAVPASRRLEVRASADRGLTRDAPPLDVRLGLVVFFDAPRFGKR
ncbi:MAG TPA: hypothetical protein VD838_10970 [Anaeromyxobacteraceae bacterium]|nr:hypothetical protein [Anaeromyxobacteraceae bacterium]